MDNHRPRGLKSVHRPVARRWAAQTLRRVSDRLSPTRALLLPESGYERPSRPTPTLDALTDEQIADINRLLPWRCFTVDGRGRRVGDAAGTSKRADPQPIPDTRIETLDELVSLADRTVLEVGCFEGVHTIALCDRAAAVIAVDARVENVVKTRVRTWLYDTAPTVQLRDVEVGLDLDCDVLHHVGVLYHLADPVQHLHSLLPRVSTAVMIDTHYADPTDVDSWYDVGGLSYGVRTYQEQGLRDPFSGMQPTARWLLLEDLERILAGHGFDRMLHHAVRSERNGRRVNMIASRSH